MEQDENYYRLPFFKRFGLKIKQKFKDFKTNFHFPWVKFLIFFIVVIILVIVVLIVSKGSLKFPTKKPYDKTGFISADEVTDANYTFENDRYQFIFDVATTHFSIKDKLNNETWLSHPSDKTDVNTLTLYYSKSLGAAKSFGNYSNSIDYNGTKRFNIRVDEEKQSVEVLYLVGGKIEIDYTDLPELISKERLENFVFANVEAKLAELKTSDPTLYSTVNKEYTIAKKSYVLNEVSGIYKLDNPKALSKNYVEKIYDLFYNYALYSKEELNKDNIENGSESSKTYPTFEVSMKYQLTEDGLDVLVENDSIVDYESEPLVYIDVLPYFGCVDTTNKGYALIPDGSGVLLDFNSPRSYANSYESRIYGRELAKVNYTMLPENQNIKFGMFGIHSVVDSIEKGIISAIEKGSETCSILANICTKNQTAKAYNQVYYRYYYRETDTYKFASLAGFSDIQTWTNNYNSTSLKFKLISVKDKGTYSDMASDYKDYLIKKEILKDYSVDSKLSFDLTLLGGYLAEENFLGVTYKKVESLTTSKQVLELANKLKSKSIENVNIIYEGFANGGIKSDYSGNWEYNNAIVSKKELQQLNNQIKDLGMSLYPSVRISSSYTLKQISSNDVIKNLYGANCPYYDASEAELIADETTTPLYYLQGKTYAKTFKEVNKKLNQVGIKNLALLDMGNLIYGTYRSKDTLFRSDTLSSYEEVMKEYVDNYQSIISYAPNDYALKYTSKILDCPFSGTNYQVVLCSVPFYQLVISGYIGYSGESINLNDKESLNYYLMKSLETGSSIAMTWTAEDTIKLIQTEYDNYYSTYYGNWLDKAISMFETLEAISSTHSYLVKHELLNQDGTLTKSTFANGSEIIFNYNTGDVTYDGVTIPKNGYFVLKAGD